MSAGRFVDVVYQSDTGELHLMTIQPETAEADIAGTPNAAPAGPATSDFWFQRNRGATEYGGKPRFIRMRWNVGGAPAGYSENSSILIPVLSAATYNSAVIGSAVSYLGGAGTVSRKIPENIYPGI